MFWKTERPLLAQNTRVLINIWLPRVNGKEASTTQFLKAHTAQQINPNNSRIGHVSIETSHQYASWWPAPKNGEQVGVFNIVGSQNSTYAHDCASEGGQPDLRICLYSLEVDKIEHCFTQVQYTPYGYVLAGDKKISRLSNSGGAQKGQSCCGLAYELLAEGGVLKLSRTHNDLTMKWLVVTTDNFAEFVKNVKQYEWEAYPETQAFPQIDNEFIPQPAQTNNWCSLQ